MIITILRETPSFEGTHVRYTENGVSAHISPASDLIKHPGTLTITDECLYFYSPQSSSGFAVPYPAIIIHATARESPFGPSIYCQIEGSLQSRTGAAMANGSKGHEESEEEDDSLLEIYFTPPQPTSLDGIYENLSYCVSLHPDGDAEFDEDDEDMYEDDENDHDALYMEADIQGGYTPRNSSTAATSIGMTSDRDTNTNTKDSDEEEGANTTTAAPATEIPAIDLNSGEWYTGNPETDAKFELSEEGKANLERMEKMLQDPHHLLNSDTSTPTPDEEEPGQDAEEDRFKGPSAL
ncbi:hypothetical protein BGW42_006008 [Actinomortierella wolfii]|nr:hypothetical protein BGW42_006008 [Actinomortierella wolfii]KAG0241122.1 hypothetical protein BGW41_006228 [Actinomortierella wolfii]